ncbi:glutathione-disulfide reductase [Rhodobacteraceae bacterium WD3A24]|nr:glutathione-disulfide reductase [Rhodobacteraceae bacterium WD3A24]
MAFDYDLFVIGGGSGGVRAARISAQHGARVGLAEEDRMGGTCVIRGCVPKKLMVFASEFSHSMGDARAYGWDVRRGKFDWKKFHGKLTAELDRLEGAYRGNLDKAGVEVFDQRAHVADPHTVVLADGRKISAKHILIAVGGRPFVPPQWADKGVMTSNDIFHMDSLPKTALIVGGGYIACEFACILNGLGVEVTQYYRGAQILRGFDGEARGHVAELMEQQGIDLHVGTDVIDIAPQAEGLKVKATDGRERVFDKALFATGRKPNTEGLGLEEAGVRLGRWGQVEVDAYSQSSVPSIYAVGDVTERVNLTPVAIREGHAFGDTVFGGQDVSADHALVPSAVFTYPQLGSIGLTEEEARDREPIDVYCTSFRAMHSSFAGRPDRVMMKLVVSRETDRVLGCHIIADDAGEMIQLAGVAIKMGATKADFDRTVAVHPTMAEELVTMREPVRSS